MSPRSPLPFLLGLCLILTNAPAAGPALDAWIKDGQLGVRVTGLHGASEVEIYLCSDRNLAISKSTDVSRHDPSGAPSGSRAPFWYPVIDVALEAGLTAIARFDPAVTGNYSMNGMFFPRVEGLQPLVRIDHARLMQWENSLATDPASVLREFQLVLRLPVGGDSAAHTFTLLSSRWSGRVLARARTASGELAAEAIVPAADPPASPIDSSPRSAGPKLDRTRLVASLRATLEFTLRAQDRSPGTPTNGGLNLFYDHEARTFRRTSWIWGWGPSIKLLLAAANEVPELATSLPPDRLKNAAREIGQASRRFQEKDPARTTHGIVTSRWRESEGTLGQNAGFEEYYSVADALFLIGWGWLPLYQETGDRSYLDDARLLLATTRQLLGQFEIIPMDYIRSTGQWKNYTINEAGFGPEGIAAVYATAPEPWIQDLGRTYMDRMLQRFQQADGLWARRFEFSPERTVPSQRHTRGEGWAMEGLISAYTLTHDEKYLGLAVRMAAHLIAAQQPDGSWNYEFDQPAAKVGTSEKGTALWSLLFYRLYAITRNAEHLQAGRRALGWCLDNQSSGPDPDGRGGIIGLTFQSGVTYRPWFPLACTYTSAFFGLAVLEELKCQGLSPTTSS